MSDGNVFDTKPVIVDRKLLEEALAYVEASSYDWDRGQCSSCSEYATREPEDVEIDYSVPYDELPVFCDHKPTCAMVTVRDGLRKALGK